MKPKYFFLMKLFYFLPLIFVLNCSSSETQQNEEVEFPVKLFVINGNGRNFNPAHIRVTFYGIRGRNEIYQNVVVDGDFTENGGHNWKSFNLSLKQGQYTAFVECTDDSSKMTVSFEIDKLLWLYLAYTDTNHFSINISSRPFVLG